MKLWIEREKTNERTRFRLPLDMEDIGLEVPGEFTGLGLDKGISIIGQSVSASAWQNALGDFERLEDERLGKPLTEHPFVEGAVRLLDADVGDEDIEFDLWPILVKLGFDLACLGEGKSRIGVDG